MAGSKKGTVPESLKGYHERRRTETFAIVSEAVEGLERRGERVSLGNIQKELVALGHRKVTLAAMRRNGDVSNLLDAHGVGVRSERAESQLDAALAFVPKERRREAKVRVDAALAKGEIVAGIIDGSLAEDVRFLLGEGDARG